MTWTVLTAATPNSSFESLDLNYQRNSLDPSRLAVPPIRADLRSGGGGQGRVAA
jgi:hypothetical protein